MLTAIDSHDSLSKRRAAWMADAQAGDARAYKRVLGDSVDLINAVARRRGVAKDHVVEQTLITIHRVRHTYDPNCHYDAWLRAIASRQAIEAIRSMGRNNSQEVHDDSALETHMPIRARSASPIFYGV